MVLTADCHCLAMEIFIVGAPLTCILHPTFLYYALFIFALFTLLWTQDELTHYTHFLNASFLSNPFFRLRCYSRIVDIVSLRVPAVFKQLFCKDYIPPDSAASVTKFVIF